MESEVQDANASTTDASLIKDATKAPGGVRDQASGMINTSSGDEGSSVRD